MLLSPPTEVYLERQGFILTGHKEGDKIFLAGTPIQLGKFYRGQSSMESSDRTIGSLNLCQQKSLKNKAHLLLLIGEVQGGDIMLQDVLFDDDLFRYLRDSCGYHVIVVPISRTSPQWCMVLLTRKSIDTIQVVPLHQHNGRVAEFHRAYSDILPLAENESQKTSATYLMVYIRTSVSELIGNVYFPCTIGEQEREKNIILLSRLVSENGGVIAGDWNIYGTRVDDVITTRYPFKMLTRLIPDVLAGKLGIHRNGDVARYPLGIVWNIATQSDIEERKKLQKLAHDNYANLHLPSVPTISKGPIGMTLDGILIPQRDHWSVDTRKIPLSDHKPIIAKKTHT